VQYPLLAGSPSFCGTHHNPHDAGRFGCDFSGPDDFDIPGEWDNTPIFVGTKETFVWTSKDGRKHKLHEIDDTYLSNIIRFLDRRVKAIYDHVDHDVTIYWSDVLKFLNKERNNRCRI